MTPLTIIAIGAVIFAIAAVGSIIYFHNNPV